MSFSSYSCGILVQKEIVLKVGISGCARVASSKRFKKDGKRLTSKVTLTVLLRGASSMGYWCSSLKRWWSWSSLSSVSRWTFSGRSTFNPIDWEIQYSLKTVYVYIHKGLDRVDSQRLKIGMVPHVLESDDKQRLPPMGFSEVGIVIMLCIFDHLALGGSATYYCGWMLCVCNGNENMTS